MANSGTSSKSRHKRLLKIPGGVQPKIDLIKRLARDISRLHRHFEADVKHWRNSPARRRLEKKRTDLALVLDALRENDPRRARQIELETQEVLKELNSE